MAFSHGKDAVVYMGGYTLTAFLQSVAMPGVADVTDVTTFGATDRAYIPGLGDANVSAEGFFSEDFAGAAADVDDVLDAALGAASTTVQYIPQGGDVFGNIVHLTEMIETSYDIPASVADAVKVVTEGQSIVGRERGVILHPLAAEVATGNGSTQDNLVATTNGGSFYVFATNIDAGTVTVTLRESTDNFGADDTLVAGTSVAITANHQEARINIPAGTALKRYQRIAFTFAGATTCTLFAASYRRP